MAILSAFCGLSRSRGRLGSVIPATNGKKTSLHVVFYIDKIWATLEDVGRSKEEADRGERTALVAPGCPSSDVTMREPARWGRSTSRRRLCRTGLTPGGLQTGRCASSTRAEDLSPQTDRWSYRRWRYRWPRTHVVGLAVRLRHSDVSVDSRPSSSVASSDSWRLCWTVDLHDYIESNNNLKGKVII